MKAAATRIAPDEFILSALSPAQRLDAAFRVAREAFRHATLTVEDIEAAVRKVRMKRDGTARRKSPSRR